MFETLERLRNLDLDRVFEIDELLVLRACARHLKIEFDAAKITPPRWLIDNTSLLETKIAAFRRESLLKRVSVLQSRKESMKPIDQKRAEVDAELESIMTELT